MAKTQKRTGHAVVIGGSIAGLAAARALSGHFAKVTVIERDEVGDELAPRKGVPQSRHAHGLLAGGREALERMFPGFSEGLIAGGATDGDLLNDSRWFGHGVELAREPSGLRGLLASRPLIETQVRRHVRSLANVELRQGLAAAGLRSDAAGRRVTGVTLQERGQAIELPADLVVDASGRGSRSGAWLEALGFAAAKEEAIGVGISYTTRQFERRTGVDGAPMAIIVGASPPNWRVGVALAMENDRWIVTLGGYFGEAAPADEAGFLAYAQSLGAPAIAELLADAVPISDFSTYRFAGSQRRRYERLKQFPEGFLVFGDAICSFNPIYGQGMTSAVLQAEALDACLAAGRERLAPRFFKAAAKVIDTPWQMAAGADLGHPAFAGKAGAMQKLMNRYIVRLQRSAAQDASLSTAFLTAANLLAKPSRLFAPSVVWAVARGAWFTRQKRPVQAARPRQLTWDSLGNS